MRSICEPFVVALPAGARVRTRLRLSAADQAVVRAVGEYLGGLAGADLAWRGRLGPAPDQRTVRKRTLTGRSSSRWAGSITRTSNDQWQRALANLADHRIALRQASRTIRSRLAVPAGGRQGRVRGYASGAERFAKQGRLQHLQAELAEVEDRLAHGRVAICRGGRRLAKLRHTLKEANLTKEQWRARWQAERLFLTADGDAEYPFGNGTVVVHPEEQWLELRLPTPLAHLANRPGGRYRLACRVAFTHRGEEWAAQAVSGAVRYDISYQPDRDRWYLHASWRIPRGTPPELEQLRQDRALAVDLNADHLDAWVLDPSGNPVGPPHTIPLELDGQPASTRNGRLRKAITTVLHLAAERGCRSILVENLDFADARQTGRETLGRGRRGKRFRRVISGIPTRAFRDLLVGMAANHYLWVIAVDPGWTSKWGRRYWQVPLNQASKKSVTVSGHHAAAVVIGRRGLGLGARRRPGVPGHDRRIVAGELPARPDHQRPGREGPGPPGGQRAAAQPRKTCPAERIGFGDQVVQDRSGPPEQDTLLLTPQERFVYPICGDIRTLPGLPIHAAVHRIDLDGRGEVTGLS
jgi:Formate--tetrahydrofolate ligase